MQDKKVKSRGKTVVVMVVTRRKWE